MSGTTVTIDKTWAEKVLGKLGKSSTTRKRGAREESGYAWHRASRPDTSLVGSRAKQNQHGIITTIDIAGRPEGKHGGKQGQHTTAFGANREVILAATVGRTEAQARADIACLFDVLLTYPAFADKSQPAVDKDLVTMLGHLKDPTSTVSTSYSVNELSTLYLEIRDALPGASVDTGVTGKSSKSSRKNIVGKGEGTSLAQLRSMEEHALANRGSTLHDDDVKLAARCMAELYDSSAETSAGMSDKDAHAQQLSFLKTIAQAFPQTFLSVGSELVKKLNQLEPNDAANMITVCTRLASNNTLGTRPQPKNFVARLVGETILFSGRSDSVKDAGTMGDHTCAEQLMKNAAANLLRPNGNRTTNHDLIGGLQRVSDQFRLDAYKLFNQDIDPSYPAHMVQVRYKMLEGHHATLNKLLERLGKLNADDLAAEADIIEAAELYMQLVDDRPTAVNYDAPARGHGEATTLSTLYSIEEEIADETYSGGADALQEAVGLLDCVAAYNTAFMMFEHAQQTDADGDEAFETCLACVADEFLFFLESAYPHIYRAILLAVDDLSSAVIDIIREKGQAGTADGDEEYDDDDAPKKKRTKREAPPRKKSVKRARARRGNTTR